MASDLGTGGVAPSSSRIAATLAATTQRLAAGDWRPEVDGLLSSLVDAVGAEAASLFELRPRDERWSAVLVATWPRETAASEPETLEELSGRWVRLLAEGRALPGDTDRASWYVTRILDRGGRSGSLIVPIVTGNEAWGFITVERPRQRPSWSDDDLALLGAIGSVIGAAIVRERADRHLRDVELRYQTLVEQIPAITYIDQPDPDSPTGFRPIFISPQSQAILGYAPAEIEGDPVLWIQLLHEEDRERALAADARHHSTGDPLANEYRLLARDGRIVWVHDEARMVTDVTGQGYSHGVLLDITERKLVEQDLHRAMDALALVDAQRRKLLVQLVNAQEDERARVARGIHDESLQQLAFVAAMLESLRRSESDTKDDLDRVYEAVRAAMESLRGLLFDISPPMLDEEGLAAAVEAAIDHTLEGTAVRGRFTGQIVVEPPAECAVIAYRIVQEALANVRRHANASRVSVAVGADEDGISVRIRDDGTGFAVRSNDREGHFGLAIMRERAQLAGGWFRIESSPDDGTTVEAWIPAGERRPPADEAASPPSPT
jgi:PAS domain S-box-containing protein